MADLKTGNSIQLLNDIDHDLTRESLPSNSTLRKFFTGITAGVLGFGAVGENTVEAAEAKPHKPLLIEMGFGMRNVSNISTNIATIEKQVPLDGLVMSVTYQDSSGKPKSFYKNAFGTNSISWEQCKSDVQALQSTPFTRLTNNFILLTATPGDTDWFQNFAPIINNCEVYARIVEESHGKAHGICLDLEHYGKHLFDYADLVKRYQRKESFEAYQAQVRKRGEEVMGAFINGAPSGLTILLPIGYGQVDPNISGIADRKNGKYGLLASFIDGLVFAASKLNATAGDKKIQIVDCNETGFGLRDEAQFAKAHKRIKEANKALSAVPADYSNTVTVGSMVWVDCRHPKERGGEKTKWDPVNHSNNYYTPEQLENAITAAARNSDGYTLVYSENAVPYGASLTPPYREALRKTHDKLATETVKTGAK